MNTAAPCYRCQKRTELLIRRILLRSKFLERNLKDVKYLQNISVPALVL